MAKTGGQFGIAERQHHIFQDEPDEFGELVDVETQVSFNRAAQQLFQRQIEIKQFAQIPRVLKMSGQRAADFGDAAHKRDERFIGVVAMPEKVVENALQVIAKLMARVVDGGLKIG